MINYRAQFRTLYPPCAQSRVWWSVQPGGGRFRSTAPRGPFPHALVRSGRARYQRPPPTLWVCHTEVLTPRPCSPLCAWHLHLNLMVGSLVGFQLDTTGVHNHLKHNRSNVLFQATHFPIRTHFLFWYQHQFSSSPAFKALSCSLPPELKQKDLGWMPWWHLSLICLGIHCVESIDLSHKQNLCASGLTWIPDAADRWAVSGWSGSILPRASCRQGTVPAEPRVFLRLRMKMSVLLVLTLLLRSCLMLRERPVTAGRTPSGRGGAQACQLRLQTK